jgi:hypothetical protein
VDRIVETFQAFCKETFAKLRTDMSLTVRLLGLNPYTNEPLKRLASLQVDVPHRASWWLASPENEFFRTMEGAIKTVWDQQPLRIREGGVSHPYDELLPLLIPFSYDSLFRRSRFWRSCSKLHACIFLLDR